MELKKLSKKKLLKKHYCDYKFMFNWVDKKNEYY